MAAAQSSLQIEPPPSSEGVARAMSSAFQALRNANAEVIDHFKDVTSQRQHLDEDRKRITAERQSQLAGQAELSGLRGEVEAKLVEVAEATEKVQQDAQAIDAEREEAARDAERLARLDEELGSREQVIAERRRNMDVSIKCLTEKEESVARAGQKVEEELGELASQREKIQQESDSVNDRQSQLGERSDQLELYAKELDGSRSALEAMQVQLLRDQSEIAVHREALLTQIARQAGSTGRQADGVGGAIESPDAPAKRTDESGSASSSVSIPKAPKSTPKAGGGSSAEQFRKLRRDAKRKSIGL